MTVGGGVLRHAARSFAVVGVLLAAACFAPPTTPVGAQSLSLEIHAQSLPLKVDDAAARQVGRLIWRGGLALTANSANFGGWSDLYVTPDGKQLTSISDVGGWLTAMINYDKDGNLAGLSGAKIGPLHMLDGKPLVSKVWSDSEGMAHLPDGSWLVSFERRHRFWRYPTLESVPVPVEGPSDIDRQPDNGGIEALTALADGTVVAISEEYREQRGAVVGWIGTPSADGRYSWEKFQYATVPDFHPTAIVELPDGSFATLERAYDVVRGVRVRVMRFAGSTLKPGAVVKAEELAFLAHPYAVDNLEGISVSRGARGETLLWLIADDNFNPAQRNLLLLFELAQ